MADEKTYTPAEAAQILKKAAADKIKQLEGQLTVLRKRELGKALIPPHAHNTGLTVSAGTEDVPPGKLGKDELEKGKVLTHVCAHPMCTKGISGDSEFCKTHKKMPGAQDTEPVKEDTKKDELAAGEDKPEETTAPGEETSMAKEELCKKCGNTHKAEGCMDKSMGPNPPLMMSEGELEKGGLKSLIAGAALAAGLATGGGAAAAPKHAAPAAAQSHVKDSQGRPAWMHPTQTQASIGLPDPKSEAGQTMHALNYLSTNTSPPVKDPKTGRVHSSPGGAGPKFQQKVNEANKMFPGSAGAQAAPAHKAELVDSKGKRSSNSEVPDASMPDDKGGKEVSAEGSGGKIKKGKSLGDLRKDAMEASKKKAKDKPAPKPVVLRDVSPDSEKKAELDKAMAPPTAKPPGGANMGTAVPTSAPKTPKMAGGAGTMGKAALSPGMAGKMQGGGATQLTSPNNPGRANMLQDAQAGAFQPSGPVHSGLELDTPKKPGLASPKAAGVAPAGKPGIFGRLSGPKVSGQK